MTPSAPPETPEQAFARFQQNGDPAALAAVFDQTAPRLLLLAAHVTPDAGAAEDLLQETFLQAMQKAAQWDVSRPLLPWLGGILRHRAQDLARRLKLRRPTASLEDVAAAATGPGPRDEAETAELLGRVQAALDALEPPYREALVLRLVHGLEPTEIAHALGRPPATVRTQLKRGLERLRGALPAALAGALAMLLLPGRGMAATRAAVLAAAGKGSTTAAATVTKIASKAAPRRAVWLVAGAAVLGLGLGAYLLFGEDAEVQPGGVPAERSSAAQADPDGVVPDSIAGRREVAAPPVEQAGAAAATTTLRGRLVRAAGGAPIPAGKAVVSFGRGRFVTSDPDFRQYPDPIEARVAGDGTFAVALQPTREMRVFLDVEAPGHVSVSTVWTSLKSGRDFDLGDIPLVPGCELGGRVVDENGVPVADVALEIARRGGSFGDGHPLFSGWSSFETTSGPGGVLTPQTVPAPGVYAIEGSTWRPGWRVLRPTEITIGSEPSMVPDIVVGKPVADDSMSGHIVDARGNPVAGVRLSLIAEIVTDGSAPSDDAGHFWLSCDYPQAEHELYLPVTERRYRLLDPGKRYARGGSGLAVRVERLPTFDVTVEISDARSGQPVTEFGLCWIADHWTEEMSLTIPPDRIYRPVPAEHHPGGRAMLTELPPCGYRLCVWPADPELATAYLVPFAVGDRGADPVRIELHGHAPLSVVVQDEEGDPVRGVEVSLIHKLASKDGYSGLFSVEQFARGVGGGRSTAAILQTETTDVAGKTTLRAPVAESRLRLQVKGPQIGYQAQAVEVLAPAGGEVLLTVESRAQVVGKVGPPELLAMIGPDAEVRQLAAMVREEDSDLSNGCPVICLVGEDGEFGGRGVLWPDGTFRIESAVPGDWRLEFDVQWRMNPGFYRAESITVGEVRDLRAGEAREVEFEVTRFDPARLHGYVTVDAAPPLRGKLGLLACQTDERLFFNIELGTGGRFDRVLRPGTYLPYVTWESEAGSQYLFAGQRHELRPGSDRDIHLSFDRRALRLTLLAADGSPAAGQRLRFHAVDFPEVHEWLPAGGEADDDGVITIDPAPPGRVQFFLPVENGALLGEVAAGPQAVTAQQLRLPR